MSLFYSLFGIVITRLQRFPELTLPYPQNGRILLNIKYFNTVNCVCVQSRSETYFLFIVHPHQSVKIPKKAFSDTASALLIIDHEYGITSIVTKVQIFFFQN